MPRKPSYPSPLAQAAVEPVQETAPVASTSATPIPEPAVSTPVKRRGRPPKNAQSTAIPPHYPPKRTPSARSSKKRDAALAQTPESPAPEPESSSSTPRRSGRVRKKARLDSEDLVQDTPDEDDSADFKDPEFKAPPRAPARATANSPDEDEAGTDRIRVFHYTGTSSEIRAKVHGMILNRHRAYNYNALWGLFEPPDLLVMTEGQAVAQNEDEPDQGHADTTRAGILWPRDGLARTRLASDGLAPAKKDRAKIWINVLGQLPPSIGLNDMSWWPGKVYGYKESIARARWAQQARASKDYSQELIGWPFVHPRLDHEIVKLLKKSEASVYHSHTHSSTLTTFQHPLHVSTSGMSKPPPAVTPSKGKKAQTADADEDDEPGSNAVSDDEDDEAAQQASNRREVSLSEPNLRQVSNIGVTETIIDAASGESISIALGPHGSQQDVSIPRGKAVRLDSYLSGSDSHILNVGGHVYDLDWAPVPIHLNRGKEVLAISPARVHQPRTTVGHRAKRPTPGSIQIWSLAPDTETEKGHAVHEMNICVDSGTAFKLAWCPGGHDFRDGGGRLGLLAGVFEDGSVSIFSVPSRDLIPAQQGNTPADVKLDPVLRLELSSCAAVCFDWAGGETIAAGCSNGFIAIWNVGSALRRGLPTARPTHYFPAHPTSLTSISWLLQPPISASGVVQMDAQPQHLLSSSYAGNIVLTAVGGTGESGISQHHRAASYALSFNPFASLFVTESADCSASMFSTRPDELGRTRQLASTLGRITALSSSAYHPVVAVASAAGEVKLANAMRANRRHGKIQTTLFRLVTERKSGKLAFLDKFVPESVSSAELRDKRPGSWPPQLAVTTTRWNPNIGRALLLASGMGAGLVRIDWTATPQT